MFRPLTFSFKCILSSYQLQSDLFRRNSALFKYNWQLDKKHFISHDPLISKLFKIKCFVFYYLYSNR